ncbi:MAG: ribonuclease HII [Methanomicrobiales archaeon]|nr:ribonuclease HII [Methanomicrobiales archaeon]
MMVLICCGITLFCTMVIGVDEAGKGPVLGPMVISAIACENEDELREIGVRDSKALTPKKRKEIYNILTTKFPYYSVVITASEIDALRETMSMNVITAKSHAMAIKQVAAMTSDTISKNICVDACDVNEKRYGTIISGYIGSSYTVVARHRADSLYPVVAAASIIAKVTRDTIIEDIKRELYDEWGNIGSGYPSDPKTVTFLKNYIEMRHKAPYIARSSWATVKNMLASQSATDKVSVPSTQKQLFE